MTTKKRAPAPKPGVETITLGGKVYEIPKLVPRQMREVHEPLTLLNDRINDAVKAGKNVMKDVFGTLNPKEYDALLLRPIYWALTRAHPELEYDDFLEWENLEDQELKNAWFVVRGQAGIFVLTKKREADSEGEGE